MKQRYNTSFNSHRERDVRLVSVLLLEPPDSLMIVTYLRGTGTSHCWLHTGPARVLSGYPGDISLLATRRACTGPHLLPRVHLTAGYTQGLYGASPVTPGAPHWWLYTGPAWGLTCHPGCISLLATHRACMGPLWLPRVHLTAGYTQGLHGSSLVTPGTSHCWLHTGPARVLTCYPGYPHCWLHTGLVTTGSWINHWSETVKLNV